jgi:integrase
VKKPRYVNEYIDANGHARFYFRRAGAPLVPLPGLPWSPEFMAAYEQAAKRTKAPGSAVIGESRTVGGTVNAAIVAYYQSHAFRTVLAPGTQAGQRGLIERFRKECGDLKLRGLQQAHVQRYVSSLGSPPVQRNMLRALRHLLKFCTAAGLIGHDPTAGVARAKMKYTGGFLVWTEEHVAKYETTHPVGTMARLALALYLNLGVRKSDVVRIGPRNCPNGVLTDFLPQKTSHSNGKRINVPLLPETRAMLAATPLIGTETYLVNSWGKPFTANGFGNKMREWCDQAGLLECTSHGLRKLCLTRLADIEGMDVLDLAAISGHKDLRELQIYIDAADRTRRAKRAIGKLEAAQRGNTD